MIASLKGVIVQKDTQGIVLECAGVGYGVAMSLSALTKVGVEGSDVQVFVHTHVSQDSLRLFGFVDAQEQQVFRILMATSGVGPRLALQILSALSPEELSLAVAQGDKGLLVKVPGVGAKKAARLLLELKDKLPEAAVSRSKMMAASTVLSDLVGALVNLGFKEAVAEHAAQQAIDDNPAEKDVAILVRDALRATTRI